ncbi:MAG: hypothetical protein ACK5CE_09350 [Actinomycetes bacterium]
MIASRHAKRFVAAFAIAIVVVAVTVAVRGGRSSDSADDTAASPPDTVATITTVGTTGPDETVPANTRAAPESTTESASTLPAIGTLPVLDMASECVAIHGDGATPIASADGPPMACLADGEERPFDADSACEARFGARLLSVKVLTDDGGVWKCLVADRVTLGQPDWQRHCEQAHGAEAVAFVYQSNSSGWACGSVRNGIYLEYIADLDQACHVTYGTETFGIALEVEDGGTPEDNICYGAQP